MPDLDPDFLEVLHTATQAVVKSTWPELVTIGSIGRRKNTGTDAGGVWDEMHIETVPFDQLTPPYGVIDIDELVSANGEYGATNDAYLAQIAVYYFVDYQGAFPPPLPRLMVLRRALNQTDAQATGLQVLRVERFGANSNLLPNQILTAKGASIRCGRLIFTALCGEPFRAGME